MELGTDEETISESRSSRSEPETASSASKTSDKTSENSKLNGSSTEENPDIKGEKPKLKIMLLPRQKGSSNRKEVKTIPSIVKKSSAVKTAKTENIIIFKDGIHFDIDSSLADSKKSSKLVKSKKARNSSELELKTPGVDSNTHIKFLEHKYVQCNVLRSKGEVEAILPEEINLLLEHSKVLLESSEADNGISCLLCKITNLMEELSSKSITKIHEFRTDYSTKFEDTSDKINILLKEHVSGVGKTYNNIISDLKRAEKEVLDKSTQIQNLKEKMEERSSKLIVSGDVNVRLRDSIIENERLKSEIKFNQSQFKKYKKLLTEKEFAKQKAAKELESLRKKVSKLGVENAVPKNDTPNYEDEVMYGGMLTKYVKIKSKNLDSSKKKEVKPKLHCPLPTRPITKPVKMKTSGLRHCYINSTKTLQNETLVTDK